MVQLGYFNDRITMSPKLTLNVGVRYDRYSSFLPEQGNPGHRPVRDQEHLPVQGRGQLPDLLDVRAARVGGLRPDRRGPHGRARAATAATSAAARARRRIRDRAPTDVNPNAIITRTYSNWDGSIPYVPVPANLTSTSGGGTNRTIDPDLKGPYVDEYTAGLDVGLNRDDDAPVQLRAQDRRQRQQVASTTRCRTTPTRSTTTGVDPGRDNVTGTADDQTLTVYSVPRTYPTFGQNIERIVQARRQQPLSRVRRDASTSSTPNNWSFLVSFDTDYRDLRDNAPRNPNEALYGPGTTTPARHGVQRTTSSRPPSWNYAVRLSGTYQLPWGITYASSFTAQSGDYFFREVQIRDALNTQRRRFASSRRPAATSGRRSGTTASRSGSRRSAASRSKATFDLYNSLNTNTITAQTNRNGSTYRQPTEIIAPRVFRVGVRYRF